jgi:ferredoxin
MKVTADEDRCCGAGTCAMLAPDVFDQRDEDGIVVVLDEAPGADQHDVVRQAADMCPAAAIVLAEES